LEEVASDDCEKEKKIRITQRRRVSQRRETQEHSQAWLCHGRKNPKSAGEESRRKRMGFFPSSEECAAPLALRNKNYQERGPSERLLVECDFGGGGGVDGVFAG
jgi:hypothetical protein